MDNILHIDFAPPSSNSLPIYIDPSLLAPAVENTDYELAADHTCDPIKRVEDIERMSKWYIDHKRYRDNMLFILGINFGLRISDLLTLRFSYLIDENLRFKKTFPILEKKTKNTRKVRRNRYVTINQAVVDAVTLYLTNTPNVCLSDYLFRSSHHACKDSNQPIRRYSAERILKEAADALQLDCHVATHTLRKTFGYHQMRMSGNDPRKLTLLQKIYGHSSAAQTLSYIGITSEEIEDAYTNLNLGLSDGPCLIDSDLVEDATIAS